MKFCSVRQRLMGIEEHPLIVMDCTLDRPNYMNISKEAAFNGIKTLADANFYHQGEFVCLWHNNVLASTETNYHRSLYPRVWTTWRAFCKQTETRPFPPIALLRDE